MKPFACVVVLVAVLLVEVRTKENLKLELDLLKRLLARSEEVSTEEESSCPEYSCDNGAKCYSEEEKCNHHSVCNDGSDDDKVMCGDCPKGSNYCDGGTKCFNINEQICDGNADCDDGFDEEDCFGALFARSKEVSTEEESSCPEYSCDNGAKCYSEEEKCNHHSVCNDGSDDDKVMCGDCPKGSNYCDGGTKCFNINEQICDGNADCDDGFDEEDCFGALFGKRAKNDVFRRMLLKILQKK